MLEFRCYHAYKLKYMLFHIHFRLQAAIFDTLLTLTYESVRTSPTVFLDLKNGGFPGSSLISHPYREILVTCGL